MKPYKDTYISDDERIRIFDSSIDEFDLVWHQDKRDRTVEVLEGNGWMFQFEDELPINMTPTTKIDVPKMKYHRVLKGTTPLTIKIIEHG